MAKKLTNLLTRPYEKHLQNMKNRYYDLFKEMLLNKYKKQGCCGEKLYDLLGLYIISVDDVNALNSLKIKNETLKYRLGLNKRNFAFTKKRAIKVGLLYFPVFVHLHKSNWDYVDNTESKDEKSPAVVAIVDQEKRFNASTLRRAVYSTIEHSNGNIISPYNSYAESIPVKITLKDKGCELKYVAFKKNIACEDAGDWFEYHKNSLLEMNKKNISELINKSLKYTKITNSSVFHNEEARIKELPFKISELFINNSEDTIETILENFRLGNITKKRKFQIW